MGNFREDVAFGWRMLRKHPAFTLVAVLSLALGIGANTAIFSVTNALLLRPLPYPEADQLAILWSRSPGLNVAQDWFSPAQYWDVKTQNRVFAETAIAIGASFNLTGQGGPEHVDGARVSSSFFTLFGPQPLLGRVLLPEEDETGKPTTVVLSYGFWQRRFGGDRSVIGRTLTLSGNNFTIVGVMPRSFSVNKEILPAVNGIQNVDLLLPFPMGEAARKNRDNEDFNIFAKLKPGVSMAEAQAEMDVIAGRMKQQYPEHYPPTGGLTVSVVSLLEQVVGDIGHALPVLLGAVGFVLLIACANVANLLLARAAVRQKEFAIRTAVGASRARLIGQLLTESVLLSLLGGLLGLVLAWLAVKSLAQFGPDNVPRLTEVAVDGRVLLFTALVSLLTGVLFGLVPAWRVSRVDLHDTLKDGGRSASVGSGHGQQRLRKLFVVAEVALALVLLIGAGLLIRSYQRILVAHPGYDPHNVLALRLSLPAAKYNTPETILAFFQRTMDRLRGVPGVEAVATTYSLPMSTVALAWEPITIEGYVPKSAQDLIISNVRIVSPDYFRTLGIPLAQGRLFDARDRKGEPETVIVDETLAARYWPNESPLGKRLARGKSGAWRTVVGVIRDAKQFSMEKEPPISVYYPAEQVIARNLYMVIRTQTDPAQMAPALIREIQTVDPEMPVFDVSSMDQRLSDALARRRFSMFMLSVFAVIALVLAAIGIYGVMAYAVSQRTHEIGVRVALGAQPRDVLGLVLRQGLSLALAGTTLGLIAAIGLTRLLAKLLFGVGAYDPLTFAGVAALLLLVSVLATWIPARRATRVDPMIALRCE